MRHANVRWNPGTREWFCTSCGRTSNAIAENDAAQNLDQYECSVPSVESPSSAPGTETVQLIRKPYKMTLKAERSGCRFVTTQAEDGRPSIRLELFHDTAPSLARLTVGFELLSGITPEQVKTLLAEMNERIVGVVVTHRESGST
jgi:hypothetical protein